MSNAYIELFEEYENLNIYSIKYDGEMYSEFEKFLMKYRNTYPKDLGVILYRLKKIQEDGLLERYYRLEGKRKDRVNALPSHLDSSKLRVYFLKISEKIIIFGNGGIKTTATYNEDIFLNECVESLQRVDTHIRSGEKRGSIVIKGRNIQGNLTLNLDTN